MKFSAIYQPTNLFSLKESNSTNSGAKSLLLPSPYSIKMALFNQAITIDGQEQFDNKKSKELAYVRDAKIEYCISGSFCVNNCFVTIQSLRDGTYRGKPSFREYVYLSDKIEIIANYFQVSPAYLMGWEESGWLIDPSVNNGYPVKRSMYKKTKEQEILSNLSTHEKAVIIAYHNQPEMQSAIDRILNIEEK